MSKKKKIIIIAVVIIVLIIGIVAFFIIRNRNNDFSGENMGNMGKMMSENFDENMSFEDLDIDEDMLQNMEELTENEGFSNRGTSNNEKVSTTTLSTSTSVSSALTEKVELHATYYLEEVYVEENEFVEEGEYILKYTNGTYLVAPYDCYVIGLNVPDVEGQVTNSHYVQISSSNSLMVTMNIDESYINSVSVGMEATITVTALGSTYTGYVTHVASTGNNGSFEIEIEFENDGDILLGMSATVLITV